MRNLLLRSLASLALLVLPAAAQSPCMDWSGEFALPGFDDSVLSFRTLDDGGGSALYALGLFTHVNGMACDHCARFDGAAWTPVHADPTGLVPQILHDAAGFDDGSGGGPAAFVAGSFTRPGGGNFYGVAKRVGQSWLAVGNGTGVGTGGVDVLQVFDDGSGPALYAGGTFDTMDGVQFGGIVRWDGSAWSGLGTGISGASTGILCMAAYNDGTGSKLYIGGGFTTVNGTAGVNRVAAWDGSTWTALGSGTTDVVRALATYNDGSGSKLYVGGDFSSAGGQSCNKIARWNGAWTTLPGGGVSSNSVGFARVDSLRVANPVIGQGNTLFIGGNFDFAGGLPANYVVGYRGTGWLQLGVGTTARAWALGAYNSGGGSKLHVACTWQAGGQAVAYAARWNGTEWESEGPGAGIDTNPLSMHAWDDGSGAALYAGGFFQAVAGTPDVHWIARWNGTAWSNLGAGLDGPAKAIASVGSGPGSKLYATGNFHLAGGQPANYIASWDGSAWAPLGSGLDSQASILKEHDDGSGMALYVAAYVSGVGAHGLARWNGTAWSAVDSGFSGQVFALESFDDGSGAALYALGAFVFTGQTTTTRFARWNGTVWSSLSSTLGGNLQLLRACDFGSGAQLFLGGGSMTQASLSLGSLAVWNGSTWSGLPSQLGGSPSPPTVYALESFDDGSGPALYAAGAFSSAGGISTANIARWSGSSWSALGSGLDSEVRALCSYDDGSSSRADLYAGGNFRFAGGRDAARVACWFDRCSTHVGAETCFGDGSLATACPCANFGATGRGCANSVNAQGARLEAFGETFPDTVTLHASGMLVNPNISCIFLQGVTALSTGVVFGDGVRCAGGALTRLAAKGSPGGSSDYPQAGDATLSVRGGVVPGSGQTRIYQAYYRDPNPGFCANPPGNTWNVTSGVLVTW